VLAALLLLELLRTHPSPSSPHPAPSRWPGLTVILLGAFIGETSKGCYKSIALTNKTVLSKCRKRAHLAVHELKI
jgi:hypothetical protein